MLDSEGFFPTFFPNLNIGNFEWEKVNGIFEGDLIAGDIKGLEQVPFRTLILSVISTNESLFYNGEDIITVSDDVIFHTCHCYNYLSTKYT